MYTLIAIYVVWMPNTTLSGNKTGCKHGELLFLPLQLHDHIWKILNLFNFDNHMLLVCVSNDFPFADL